MKTTEKTIKTNLASAAFLILLLVTTEIPSLLKYPMLIIAAISFSVAVIRLYHQAKAKHFSKIENND